MKNLSEKPLKQIFTPGRNKGAQQSREFDSAPVKEYYQKNEQRNHTDCG